MMIKARNSLVLKASFRNLDMPIHPESGSFRKANELSRLASKMAVNFIAKSIRMIKLPTLKASNFLFHVMGEAITREISMINGPKAIKRAS